MGRKGSIPPALLGERTPARLNDRAAAYVYTHSEDQVAEIEREVEVAQRLGLPATFVRDLSLPFPIAGAIRFDEQAQFNPCKYVLGLARALTDAGGQVFEHVRALQIEHGEPCRVATDRGTVTARDVIVAAHMPLGKEGMFFAKAYPYAHPMVAARIQPAKAPDGMFISADSPSHSVRTARWDDETYLVAAGGAYKPGHTDEQIAMFEDLERFTRSQFAVRSVDYYWTNEDYESMDGLPFVGRASSSTEHLFVATGFNAWGITNGTAAGMILADLIAKRTNPWAEIFDATRVKPVAGGPSFVGENVSAGVHLVGGYLSRRSSSIDDLASGEGGGLKAGWRACGGLQGRTGQRPRRVGGLYASRAASSAGIPPTAPGIAPVTARALPSMGLSSTARPPQTWNESSLPPAPEPLDSEQAPPEHPNGVGHE